MAMVFSPMLMTVQTPWKSGHLTQKAALFIRCQYLGLKMDMAMGEWILWLTSLFLHWMAHGHLAMSGLEMMSIYSYSNTQIVQEMEITLIGRRILAQ